MKKILIFIICLGFSVPAFAAKLEITSKKINMRNAPNVSAPVVKTFTKGAVVETVDASEVKNNNDTWVKVISDNQTGYIRITASGKPLAEYSNDNETVKDVPSILLADKIIEEVMKLSDKPEKKTSKKTVEAKLPDTESNLVFVEGEGLHRVEISLKNLNRITCPGKIGDPIYSKDKQIEIVRGGEKDLFVKISPVQTTYNGETKVVFNDFPREVFVECSGNVYNLSLIPQDITSRTVVIKTPIEDIFKAKNFEQASDYEELISNLIKYAYVEQTPDGYSAEKGSIKYRFKEMDMRLRYVYKGHHYIVEDWEITSKLSDTIELEESLFVPVLKNPRAITIIIPRIAHNEKTRLLAVRLASEDQTK